MYKYILSILMVFMFCLSGCGSGKSDQALIFGVSADYPPFEYSENGKITGFDIELAQLLANELGKEAVIENIPFNSLFVALQSGSIDAVISTVTITEERQKNFDFSDSYYTETLVMVYPTGSPITNVSQLANKKIACQLGSTMEIWLKKQASQAEIVAMDNTNQAIEALKAKHVDGVLVDGVQGLVFSQKNPGLSFDVIAKSDCGYGIAFKKDSLLKDKVNVALQSLIAKGELARLKKKWLEVNSWKR